MTYFIAECFSSEVLAKRLSSPNDFVGDPGFSSSYNLVSGLKHTAMTVFETFARTSKVMISQLLRVIKKALQDKNIY